ncbi:MAG TPA: hypothetical protein VFB02_24830 [Bradyrhizobium sp.]|nr:hypothetical protein [Bradyrhizobium sp.]
MIDIWQTMGAAGKIALNSGKKCSGRSVWSASPQMANAGLPRIKRSAAASGVSNLWAFIAKTVRPADGTEAISPALHTALCG